jgi:hypothetical protein
VTGAAAGPLTIAEIFDRAVTLVVRRRAPVALFSVLLVVPSAAFQLTSWPLPSPAAPLALLIVVVPFAGALWHASLVNVLAGRATTASAALRLAAANYWAPLRSYVLAGTAQGVLNVMCLLPARLVSGGVPDGSWTARSLGAALLGVPAAALIAPLTLVFSIAFPITVLERRGASNGIAVAWSRVMRRGGLRRAWLLGGAMALVMFGVELVAPEAVQQIGPAAAPGWRDAIETLIVGTVTLAYGSALSTLAAIDYRVRAEGVDLEAALDAREPA